MTQQYHKLFIITLFVLSDYLTKQTLSKCCIVFVYFTSSWCKICYLIIKLSPVWQSNYPKFNNVAISGS